MNTFKCPSCGAAINLHPADMPVGCHIDGCTEHLIPIDFGKLSDGYHTFDELYNHRNTLFLTVMKLMPDIAWFSKKHHGGTAIDGWFIAGLDLPGGAVTYHMPAEMLALAHKTGARHLDVAPPWDGHSSKDVLLRLQKLISS